MKNVIITSSALLMALSLTGCNTMNNAAQYTSTTVGNGVRYTTNAVGTGVGVVTNTGAAVGRGVGTVVGTGVGWVTGQPAKYRQVNGRYNNQMIYHNGHRYMLQNGRYVRVR